MNKQKRTLTLRLSRLMALPLLLVLCGTGWSATRTWITTSGTNDWSVTNNWSDGIAPAFGDDVVITNANIGVLLTNSTESLQSLLISNRVTLILSNWNTSLSATNVSILTNATITCAGPFSTNGVSNRVWIACSNLTVAAGGEINVDAKGYTAVNGGAGQGPGGGAAAYSSGGGYGGAGSMSELQTYGGHVYGAPAAPEAPGSAGGTDSAGREGGHGGGAIRIDATRYVQVEGTISANGGNGILQYSGGGSGGGVMITCQTFNGTNGIIRARGGNMGPDGGGSGGGGRIAILYSSAQSGVFPTPTVQIQLNGGVGAYGVPLLGDIGTLYIPSPAILTPTPANIYGQVLGFSSWSPGSLTITNTRVRLADEGLQLTVTNDIIVHGSSANLEIGPAVYTSYKSGYYEALGTNGFVVSAKNLQVDGGGTLNLFSGMSNAVDSTNWGGRLSITGAVTVGNVGSGTIYSVAHSTNGRAAFFHAGSLFVATNGTISSYARGYAGKYTGVNQRSTGYGPQAGTYSGGGGHGGAGGNGLAGYAGGSTYGSSNAPVTSGSAGGQYWQYGGFGGGAIRIAADSSVTVNGTINANGGDGGGASDSYNGAGAGGSIYITCRTFAGTSINGLVTAIGGNASNGGGGGGGRIAVWQIHNTYQGAISATNGTSVSYGSGSLGTIVLGQLPIPGTIFRIY